MDAIIAGVDEAGRGPLAGPVYAAAVILHGVQIEGLNDSKKLSERKRELLFDLIINKAVAYGIAWATPEEIDRLNILQATYLAMQRAVEQLKLEPTFIQVDGNRYPTTLKISGEAIVKGDSKVQEIMAASILAKVSRDRYMLQMAEQYPQYNFIKHKGYPTAEHRNAIKEFGVSPIHRKTFGGVKEFL